VPGICMFMIQPLVAARNNGVSRHVICHVIKILSELLSISVPWDDVIINVI